MRNKKHRAKRKQFCEDNGKKKYLTREDAAHDMFLLARETGTKSLSAYRCESCSEFHVGHTPQAIRERYGL